MKSAFLSFAIGSMVFTNLGGVRAAVAANEGTLRQRTDRLVQPYLDNSVIVGMTIGILQDGKRAVFGYGRMSRDNRRVPDGDTIYEVGSVTKVMTGILLADAVIRGEVKLDQPASELLPAGVKMPAKGSRVITLQDLSTHVSGLPRIPDNMKPSDLNNPYADYLDKDLYEFLNNHELARDPGEQIEYSNLGTGLLGYLLSLQAKSNYEALIRDRIAAPLKMSSTKITLDQKMQSRLAPGHLADGEPAANWNDPVLPGAGDLRTTVNDLLLFTAANLAPPKSKLGQAMEMAWTVHQEPINEGDVPLGLGWHLAPDGTHWHNGETGGYHSMILVNRNTKTSVILMTNTATMEVDELATDILRMLSGVKVDPRKFEKPIDVPAEAMQKLLGRYELAPGAVFTVEIVADKLMIGLTGQPSLEIFSRSETVWFYKVIEATITFNVDKEGKCDSLVLFQNGIKQTAKRVGDPAETMKKPVKPIVVSAEAMQKLAGLYELAPGVVFTVEVKDGKLIVKLTGQSSLQVFPHSEIIWYYKDVKATLLFNLDKEGKCESLVLLQNGIKQTAKRKK